MYRSTRGISPTVDTADIGNLLASEQLTADDAVWSKAIGEWLPISSVPALAALAP